MGFGSGGAGGSDASTPKVPDIVAPPPLPPSFATVARQNVGDQTQARIRLGRGAGGTDITGGKALVDPSMTQLKSLLGA